MARVSEGRKEAVSALASSCRSDRALTAPATSTSATKDSWEGGRDRGEGHMSRVLSLPSGSANTCQSLSGQDKSYSTAGGAGTVRGNMDSKFEFGSGFSL